MYVTPQPLPAARPWWLVLGPGFAALIGLFLLTVVGRFGGALAAEVRRTLHLSSRQLSQPNRTNEATLSGPPNKSAVIPETPHL